MSLDSQDVLSSFCLTFECCQVAPGTHLDLGLGLEEVVAMFSSSHQKWLRSPVTGAELLLASDGSHMAAEDGAERYPLIAGIPWLYPDPEAHIWQWRQGLSIHQRQLQLQEHQLKAELEDTHTSRLTRKRLKLLKEGAIRERRTLEQLLKPLGQSALERVEELRIFSDKIPAVQSLTGYFANLHRDWAWAPVPDQDENSLSLQVICNALRHAEVQSLGNMNVLGAGGCRLAFDLHTAFAGTQTVACDINPLLLTVAQRILQGGNVPLNERPLAPRSLQDVVVERNLSLRTPAPANLRETFSLVHCDALQPPFALCCFDTVLTPWFIDIVQERAAAVFDRINAILKPGGIWINFGTLVFHSPAWAQRLSPEETQENVSAAGFKILHWADTDLPYMASPASRHSRRETVTCFIARKEAERAMPPAFRHLPEWTRDHDRPVPMTPAMASFLNKHRLSAQVASLVDGARSVNAIAATMADRFGLSHEEARVAFLKIAISVCESNQTTFL
jgi:hypothetical protein